MVPSFGLLHGKHKGRTDAGKANVNWRLPRPGRCKLAPVKFDPSRPYPPNPYDGQPAVPSFTLVSADLEEGQPLTAAQTGLGGNVSPRLTWTGFPENTRSFLITTVDPDTPHGTAWHWVLSDVPATVTSLPGGHRRNVLQVVASALFSGRRPMPGVPGSLQRRNSLGATGFLGALPPKGDHAHRYIFAVHALDVDHLDLDLNAKPDQVLAAAAKHVLARAQLTGMYER